MRRIAPIAAVLCAAAVLAGCGSGPGASGGEGGGVTLLVTRDFGSQTLGQVGPAKVPGSPTVLQMLQRSFDVQTSDSGPGVQAIDDAAAGRPLAWSFFVNGVGSEDKAADVPVRAGDRIWLDLRDMSAARHVPAVVGSYPEPFLHGNGGKVWPTRVECVKGDENGDCQAVADKLDEVGVRAFKALVGTEGGNTNVRVLVGPWSQIGFDRAGRQMDEGPAASGVFARFVDRGTKLQLLDATGRVRRTLGPGTGLIAATRWDDQPPTWFVTGTDTAGVKQAIKALDEGTLGKHYALAVSQDTSIPLPVGARPAPPS